MTNMKQHFPAVASYLTTKSKFSNDLHEPTEELFNILRDDIKILVVGAGGLGCEILKNLACSGFKNIDIIDMDTIDLSNLNRQFLFREADIGKSKAEIATKAVGQRVSDLNINYHHAAVQEKNLDFYKQFNAVIAGLDSIEARRYINAVLHSLVEYENDEVDETTQIWLIDGGTEGLKGSVRIVKPGDKNSSCLDCNLDLYPPQVTFPMCTIANTPRLPEHCIEYAKVVLWEKLQPFGNQVGIDTDNFEHVQWLFEQAKSRADSFNIKGVTFRSTLGVVKNIIPAVSSTNAIVAASCVNECFKLVTFSLKSMLEGYPNLLEDFDGMEDKDQNEDQPDFTSNMILNQNSSIYSYKFASEKNENCLVCGKMYGKVHNILVKKRPEAMHADSIEESQQVSDSSLLINKNITVDDVYNAILEKFAFKSCNLNKDCNGQVIYVEKDKSSHGNLEKNWSEFFKKDEDMLILVSSKSLLTSIGVKIIVE